MNDPIDHFKLAISAAGLTPPDNITGDGKFQRFSTNGKPGDDAGSYILHLDGLPAGWFGDYRTGLNQTWCSIERSAQCADTRATKAICHAVEVYAECPAPGKESRTRCSGGNGGGDLGSGHTDRRCGRAWLPCQQRHSGQRRTVDRHGGSTGTLRQVVPYIVRAAVGDPHAQCSG